MLAAGRLRPPGGTAALPRNGRLALARQVRGMQRAHGNAAVGRMLMRATPYRTSVPKGTPSQIAAWMIERCRPVKGRDIVVVAHGSAVMVFSTAGQERQTFTRAEHEEFDVSDGVWRARRFGFDLMTYWDYAPADWFWFGHVSDHPIEHIVVTEERSAFEALIPDESGHRLPRRRAPGGRLAARAGLEELLDPRPDRPLPAPGRLSDQRLGRSRAHGRQAENAESAADLAERIRKATAKLRAARDPRNSTRVRSSRTGGRTPNAPAFPARIVSHGPEGLAGNAEFERTVTGASVNFTMDLDYASMASGFWEEFGARWQSIDYRWELIDISKLDLAQVRGKLAGPTSDDLREQVRLLKQEAEQEPEGPAREKKQAQMAELEKQLSTLAGEADSGISRDLVRSVGNTWKDTKADLGSLAANPSLGYLAVIGISDLVQVGGR